MPGLGDSGGTIQLAQSESTAGHHHVHDHADTDHDHGVDGHTHAPLIEWALVLTADGHCVDTLHAETPPPSGLKVHNLPDNGVTPPYAEEDTRLASAKVPERSASLPPIPPPRTDWV